MSIQGIIFDLDGTLVDTLDDLTDSMNAALAQLGRPAHSASACRAMIGHGLRRFAERALGPGHLQLTGPLVEQMTAHYMSHCLLKTTPYDGIEAALSELSEKGIRLAVLTNKNQAPTDRIVGHYFNDTFDPVIGLTDDRKKKPDPQTTLEILRRWDLAAGQVLFVGDSDADVQTALNAGVRCLGCLWGFRSRDELTAAGADTLIDCPRQILDHLN